MAKMNPVRPLQEFYYTYVLQSQQTEQWYTGATADLRSRFAQHQEGLVRSTQHDASFRLVYYEACRSREAAFRRERYLKSGMGKRYLRGRLKGGLTG